LAKCVAKRSRFDGAERGPLLGRFLLPRIKEIFSTKRGSCYLNN
jgi:hypothetical protein